MKNQEWWWPPMAAKVAPSVAPGAPPPSFREVKSSYTNIRRFHHSFFIYLEYMLALRIIFIHCFGSVTLHHECNGGVCVVECFCNCL